MSAFFNELIHTGVYKRSQGRITRQVTWAAMAITLALGVWQFSHLLIGSGRGIYYGVPFVLLTAGLWIAYRSVNLPAFADFLIAVEAEMNKVSWPTRTELFRASLVVLFTIFILAALLASFDLLWGFFFRDVLGLY